MSKPGPEAVLIAIDKIVDAANKKPCAQRPALLERAERLYTGFQDYTANLPPALIRAAVGASVKTVDHLDKAWRKAEACRAAGLGGRRKRRS